MKVAYHDDGKPEVTLRIVVRGRTLATFTVPIKPERYEAMVEAWKAEHPEDQE